MRALAPIGLLLAVSLQAQEVDLRATQGGRVSLRVASAPLSTVLDRIARQTGMKVSYDGPPPRALVRERQVDDVTPAEAVANVLEGLGVSYALRLDATGTRVETLLVLGATRTASGPPPAGAKPAVPPVRLPGLGNLPLPEDDPDDEVPSERSEDAILEGRPARPDERPEFINRQGPMMPGVHGPLPGIPPGSMPPGMPAIPVLPISPINPLVMPSPAPVPSPSPPPQ